MAEEPRHGIFLPIMLGVHADDEDANRINRAHNHLRAQGHGKTGTIEDLTGPTIPLTGSDAP